jgi:hypothetical protein
MTEAKKTARGLEDVSHFFLSRHSTKDPAGRATENSSDKAAEKMVARVSDMPLEAQGEKDETIMPFADKTERLRLKSAHEVHVGGIPRSVLLRAARTYLLRADDKKGFFAVENIDSPRFGSSDLLFVNKTRTRIVCAKLSREINGEAFVVSAVAFYCWLKKLMQAGASLFGRQATLDMVLFANDFTPAVTYMMDVFAADASVHLIQYNIFRVEALEHPVVRFRPVKPIRKGRRNNETQDAEQTTQTQNKDQQSPEPQDISRREWEAFQDLKEKAFT